MKKGFRWQAAARNPVVTASCFLVEGGYLNMSVSGRES